ncbi:translation initiation factor 2 [Methylobacterium sp. E-041]|uniref:COG4223 family protein n=1 Tax=Methylobacterium sp. E-041 TaxID=2836573 RepID=UPI001FBB7FC8|nr:translation initiation factor 2 [Methylobacterium sp. E-041]MCJ2108756.1 translation initiation factor 2 [Methylobacterium sp. E-041]
MKPPSNDADRPNSGSQAPGAAKNGAPSSTAPQTQGGKPGTVSTPQGRPPETLPPGVHVKSEPAKSETGKPDTAKNDTAKPDTIKPDTATPAVPSSSAQAPKPEAGRADPPITAGPTKAEPDRPAQPPADPAKLDAKPAGGAGAASAAFPSKPATEAVKPGIAGAPGGPSAAKEPGKAEPGKPDPAKPEFGRSGAGTAAEPPKSAGGATAGGPRPSGALTDGPIIDLKAKRVEDAGANKGDVRGNAKAAAAGAAGVAAGMAASGPKPASDIKPASDGKAASDAKAGAKPAGSGSTPPRVGPAEAPAARGPGFGSVATAGLLGGVIGAGLLFAVERAGILVNAGDDARLNALDQRISGQLTGLDQRMASLSPRDAVAALDKRVAANEATLKPLPDAVKAAEAAARQALDRASGATATSAEGQGTTPAAAAQAALPADIAARLDSLDQRVSALQEEPDRDQAGDSRLGVAQAGGDPKQIAALDGRVKALEDKAPDKAARAPAVDLAPKLATLQGEVEARTKANAEADQALGQRLDALQKTLDERVKAATEAVQTATQASREAAEAGRSTAESATKALDRRLQDQADKIATLDKAVALRAEASTVQAALKVVTADRIAAALEASVPYAEPLATLRKLETGDASRVDALAPFADKGAPTADQLAAAFRPIADKVAAARKAAAAKEVAANGDLKSRFLSIADSIVQVRKVDAPPAAEEAAASDPTAKVQAALDRGALIEASQAYEAMPQDLKAQAGDFGATLKARAQAAQAAQALLSDAFKGLPTTAPTAKP